VNALRISAIMLITSFGALLFSTVINAPGLYQTQDITERLQILSTHRTRWLINQAVVLAYSALVIAGFVLLAYAFRALSISWIPLTGALIYICGTLSGAYFVYLQTVDPRGGYSGAYPIPENLAYWLWLAGTLLFGVAFLQVDLPSWLGYLTAGVALVYGIIYLVTGAGFMTPFLLAIVHLVIGIVLLRQ